MFRRTLLRAALALAAPLAMAACDQAEPSDFVNQDRIFTEYDLHYDANADRTVATAVFRFGGPSGTLLELSSPSTVTVNGEALSRKVEPITGRTVYERSFAGLVQNATFVFTDTEGEAYQNTFSLRPIGFPASVGPIDNDASYTLPWTGAALGADEEVNVVLYRVANEPELGVFTQRDDGAQSVILDRQQLQNVQPGQVTLTMERKFTRTPVQATSSGGRITGRYMPQNRTAQVTD